MSDADGRTTPGTPPDGTDRATSAGRTRGPSADGPASASDVASEGAPGRSRPPSGPPPGETPPGESSTTGELGGPESVDLRRAWGPAPLVVILVCTGVVAALFAVMAVVLLLD